MKYNSLKEIEKQKKRDKEIQDFLKANPDMTLLEVAKKYDLTKQRIHQIKIKEKVGQVSGKLKINK